MFASLTLKQKILATVILAVALSCLLVGYFSQRSAQGEIVNILLKIKNSFLPTKQILIGL